MDFAAADHQQISPPNALAQVARSVEAATGRFPQCENAVVVIIGTTEESPQYFSDNNYTVIDPMTGPIIHYRATVAGCGRSSTQNFLVITRQNGTRGVIPLLPGRTLTAMRLSKDVGAALTREGRNSCSPGDWVVRDTIVSRPYLNGNWAERWFVDACGKRIVREVDFVKAATGGTQFKIREVPP